MSEPRKHHYLPQFYLAGFTNARGQIRQIEKTSEAKNFMVSAADAGAIRDFHRVELGEERDPNEVEKRLAHVEAFFARMLYRIVTTRSVPPESRALLIEFVALMRFRVPAFKKLVEAQQRELVESRMKMMRARGELPELAKIERRYGKDAVRVEIANWQLVNTMFKAAAEVDHLRVLNSMSITLIDAPRESAFVTSDQPVAYYHPTHDADSVYGVPLFDEGCELSLPLSSNLALHLSWNRDSPAKRTATNAEVEELNRRSVIMADRFIFEAPNHNEAASLAQRYAHLSAGYQIETVGDPINGYFQAAKVRCVMSRERY